MMKSNYFKKIIILSLAFIFVINTSILFAEDRINIPKSVQIYYTASDARNRTNSKGSWSAGNYYIFTRYDGMINISNSTSQPGAWINPNDIGNNNEIIITENVPTINIETSINRYSSFVVYSSMKAYGSASDAYNSRNPVTTLSSGIYYVLSASNNMLQLSNTKSNTGYWINPALNSGSYKTANDYTTYGFINEIGPTAQKLAAESDLYASVMIAQAILESGWGNSLLANKPFHNLFGVKGAYEGDSILIKTFEYSSSGYRYEVLANFRKYPSYLESLKDYVYVLTGDDNKSSWNYNFYIGVRKSRTKNYREATNYLTGRYATSPIYANSLNSIIETYGLTKYDTYKPEKLGPAVSGYTIRSYNLRNGASIDSKVVGLLKAGTYVKGNKVGDFIKLTDGTYVYNGTLLKELKEVSGYLKSDAIVSKNPSNKAIKTLKKDTYIKGKSLIDWIMLDDGTYIENKGLSNLPSTAKKVSGYLTANMNVRKSASISSSIVGYKSKGQFIEGHQIGEWIRLSDGNYIHAVGLRNRNSSDVSDSSSQGRKVSGYLTADMNVRTAPSISSSIVGYKSKGQHIEGYLNNGWIKKSDDNYVHESGVKINDESSDTNTSTQGVKVSGNITRPINVRKAPTTESAIVGYKKVGEYIEGYLNNGWIQLSDGNYIHEISLQDNNSSSVSDSSKQGKKVTGYLTKDMNIRMAPNISSSIVGYKLKDQYIEGYLNNGWIQLSDGNYIHEISLQDNNSSSDSIPNTQGVKVSGYLKADMNVRKSPEISSNIVGSKSKDQYIEGYLSNGWIQLSDGNYIHESGLK